MLDWQDLQFLMAFAQTSSMAQAAESLDVNRTTVTRRLENLEKSLGTKLVERVGRGLELTEAGHEALAAAELIQGEIQSLERNVSGRDQRIAGVIKVTATARIATIIGPDLAQFCEIYPDVLLDVSVSNAPVALEIMEADVAIRLTSNPTESLIGRKIAEPATALYADPETARRLPQLSEVNYISSALDGAVSDYLCRDLGIKPILAMKTNSMDLLKQLVAAGRGVASIPCYVAEGEPGLVRVSEPWRNGMPDLWLLYHPRLKRLERGRVFTKFLIDVFERIRPRLEGRD
jgi:DNA-binding transcriptional LysR family regulator